MKHILLNEQDAIKVRHDAKVYQTDKRMFKIPYEFEIRSEDDPMKIHFNKILTSSCVKLTPSEGNSIDFTQ